MAACARRAAKNSTLAESIAFGRHDQRLRTAAAYADVSAYGASFLLGRVMMHPIGTSAMSAPRLSQSKRLISVIVVPHKASLTQGMAAGTIDPRVGRTSRIGAGAAVEAETFRRGKNGRPGPATGHLPNGQSAARRLPMPAGSG